MSLVIACGITPIDRRTSSGCRWMSKPLTSAVPDRRRQQRRQHPDERGLAGAVRAEQTEDLALLDGEAHALDGREVAEALDEVADVDRRHEPHRSRQRKQHVGRHADGEPAILVVDAQADLERLDVALRAADVALRGEAAVHARGRTPCPRRSVAGRQSDRQPVAEPDAVDVASPRRRRGPRDRRG